MADITDIKRKILELSPANFQEFCDAFLQKKGYGLIHGYGIQPGTGNTTRGNPDTYFRKDNGKYVFVVYTIQQTNIYKKIREDIEKCFDEDKTKLKVEDIEEIICCHISSNLSSGDDKCLHDYCKERSVKLTIYGIDEIALEVFNKYHFLSKNYLGLSIDTNQIMCIEDFISMYDANKMVAPLNTIFQFRNEEKNTLKQNILYSSTVIVTGKSGVGKTKLVLETIKEIESKNNYKVLCIKSNNLSIYEDLVCHLNEKGKYILFIDDANELTGLNHVLEYTLKKETGYEVKIVVTVRDYVKKEVTKTILKYDQPVIMNINVFNEEQITLFLKENFNICNQVYVSHIMKISQGNPRIAYMAGKVAVDNKNFKSIMDVTQLYEAYYSPYVDQYLENNEKLCFISGFLAIVGGLYIKKQAWYTDIFNEMNISLDEFNEFIKKISQIEFIDIKKDKVIIFSDQCLANYMIYYAFFQKKVYSFSQLIYLCFDKFPDSIVNAVNIILNLFNNEENKKYCKEEVIKAWNKFKDNGNEWLYTEYIKSFHVLHPNETFLFVKNKVDCMTELDYKNGKDEELLGCLTGFSLKQYEDIILELVLKICSISKDFLKDGSLWLISEYGINDKSDYLKFFNEKEVSLFLTERLNNYIVSDIFLRWVEHVLKLKYSYHVNKDCNVIAYYNGRLNYCEAVRNYRDVCWKGLTKLSLEAKSKDRIIKFLSKYAKEIDKESDKKIMESDQIYIKQILENIRCDSIVYMICLRSILFNLEKIGIDNDEQFNDIFIDKKWKIYQLLENERNFSKIEYDEYQNSREKNILNYVGSIDEDEIYELVSVANGFVSISYDYINSYYINDGLRIAIDGCRENKEKLLIFFHGVIQYGENLNVSPYGLFQYLYKFMQPEEVYKLIMKYNFKQKNEWQYTFFETLPNNFVTTNMYDCLLDFFEDSSNDSIHCYLNRCLIILNKFLNINTNIYVDVCKVIMEKNNIYLQKKLSK